MSEKLTCPLCGHNETFTLITHLRNEHKVEPEAFRAQFPEETLCTQAFAAFLADREVHRSLGVLHYQLNVAGAPMTAKYGVEHPLVPQSDPTFVWTDPCRDVAEAIEHNERVFIYGPSGTGKSWLVRQTVVVQNVSRDFGVLCRRANVPRYNKPFHTLRKSCLTGLGREIPHARRAGLGRPQRHLDNGHVLPAGV